MRTPYGHCGRRRAGAVLHKAVGALTLAAMCCLSLAAQGAPAPLAAQARPPSPKRSTATQPSAHIPEPPHRPAALGAPATDASPTPQVGPHAIVVPAPPVNMSAQPPMLPHATRERMRLCADQWRALKLEAKGAPPHWRDFAATCLTR